MKKVIDIKVAVILAPDLDDDAAEMMASRIEDRIDGVLTEEMMTQVGCIDAFGVDSDVRDATHEEEMEGPQR